MKYGAVESDLLPPPAKSVLWRVAPRRQRASFEEGTIRFVWSQTAFGAFLQAKLPQLAFSQVVCRQIKAEGHSK